MKRSLVVLGLSALLLGCTTPHPKQFTLGDFLTAKELPYDSPPQVIYRIDDHRFLTLEHYRDCHHGETFYNDTRLGIRQKFGRVSIENFQGRVINADRTGMNLVFPSSGTPREACSDRGCNVVLFYSTDAGRTFHVLQYMSSSRPFKDSVRYTIAITKDKLYVAKQFEYDAYVTAYPLVKDVYLAGPYPPGVEDEHFKQSSKPEFLSGLHTPSGQDRFTCDASVRPTNPDAPLLK